MSLSISNSIYLNYSTTHMEHINTRHFLLTKPPFIRFYLE